MENGQTSYETPPDTTFMTPDEATGKIDELHAAMADKGHPLNSKMHPQHKTFTEHLTELHKCKAEGKVKEEVSPVDLKGQQRRYEEAKEVMKTLTDEHGYERSYVRKNISAAECRGLKQHLLAAEGQFDRLAEELSVDVKELKKSSPHLQPLLESFRQAPEGEYKRDIADRLVIEIGREKRKRGFLL